MTAGKNEVFSVAGINPPTFAEGKCGGLNKNLPKAGFFMTM